MLLVKPLVAGKRVKEFFQIVYDYDTTKWLFHYNKGMSGLKTFSGYRLNGNQMIGGEFAPELMLNSYEVDLLAVSPSETPPNPPDPVDPPEWHPTDPLPPVVDWQTTYEWSDVNYKYRIQRDKNETM